MKITCPTCQKSLLSSKPLAGQVKCPACGSQFSVPLEPLWHAKINGETYGPYSLDDLLAYIGEGRVTQDSLVKHRDATKDRWESVAAVPELREAVEQAPPKPVAATTASISQSFQSSMQTRMRPADQRSPWLFIVDFCDPTFKHYVTPTIIRITWCCVLLLTLVAVIANILVPALQYASNRLPSSAEPNERAAPAVQEGFQLPQARPQPTPASPNWATELAELFTWTQLTIAINFLALLWCRVLLEVCIVIFDISNTLKRQVTP